MKIYKLKAQDQSRSGWDEYVLGYYANRQLVANAFLEAMQNVNDMGYEFEEFKDFDGNISAFTFYSEDGMRHNIFYEEVEVVDQMWDF